MKILAIGAHPDDIEIFMYGLLSIYKNRGDEVLLCVATDGSLGGSEHGEELALKRKNETIEGLKLLGKPDFLNLKDGRLGLDVNAKSKILDYLIKLKPDLVITHAPEDYHSDHKALSNYISESAGFNFPVLFADTLMGVNFNPNFYIDITDFFKQKRKAILAHKTQNPLKFFQAVELCNRFRSAQCNSSNGFYAEAYRYDSRFPFADIRSFLPLAPPYRPYYKNVTDSFL